MKVENFSMIKPGKEWRLTKPIKEININLKMNNLEDV